MQRLSLKLGKPVTDGPKEALFDMSKREASTRQPYNVDLVQPSHVSLSKYSRKATSSTRLNAVPGVVHTRNTIKRNSGNRVAS